MDLTTVAIIALLILFLLLFLRMPIGYGMALIGFCGAVYVVGTRGALSLLKTFPYQYASSYDLVVIPLFVLMGEIAYRAELTWDIYNSTSKIFGGIRGSLGMATVAACAGFAAISGSSLATAATMGAVALPEMKKFKYNRRLATGCVAAGGSIGILIPPSIILVLYAIMTEQSIGKLFIAGFVPGLLEASLYMLTIYIITRIRPGWAPPGPRTGLVEKIIAIKDAWVPIVLFLIVIGGIYMGVFTPTEAAAVGAAGSFIVLFVRRRGNRINILDSLLKTGRTTGMIFGILIGAMILNYFMAITMLPMALADFVSELAVPPLVTVIFIIFIYILLGCLMDPMAMILLTVPIFFPLIIGMGYNPIWFGILVVRVVEIGMITPPIGINVFIIQGIDTSIPISEVFLGIVPFLLADFVCVALLILFPQIVLFLPSIMGG